MKFQLTFKTPDVVSQAVEDGINSFRPEKDFTHEELVEYDNIDDEDEKRDYIRSIVTSRAKFINSIVRYGEYITVEFDSEDKSAKVVK